MQATPRFGRLGWFGALALGGLTGCTIEAPQARIYLPPPVEVRSEVVVDTDDYVYYPDYQVYYSARHHQFHYLEGGAWVVRASPPRVSTSVFFASHSVKMGFHDRPAAHHEAIRKQYSKHPAAPNAERR